MSELIDDGLPTPEVGEWGEEKYRLIQLYAKLFATSMKAKWDYLVYIDLFAASGRSQVRKTNKIIPASPLPADLGGRKDFAHRLIQVPAARFLEGKQEVFFLFRQTLHGGFKLLGLRRGLGQKGVGDHLIKPA